MRSPAHASIGIVEDDPVMGGSLVQRLELEGYAPLWWQTAGDALAGLKRQRPDLLLCDIKLPDMTGEDVFRQAPSELGTSPVLFITAYDHGGAGSGYSMNGERRMRLTERYMPARAVIWRPPTSSRATTGRRKKTPS